MTETPDEKPYRANVGLALFAPNGLVFMGKRIGAPDAFQWQMPQGGIDSGESPRDAAYRELEEEIGVAATLTEYLDETEDWIAYDFPPDVAARMQSRGQRQKWFAFRFKGRDSDIRLDAHTPEFDDWRWMELKATPDLVIPFKRATYLTIARRFERHTLVEP